MSARKDWAAPSGRTDVIYLAGGCFWGVEHLFRRLGGVVGTTVGYANGTGEKDALYPVVCAGGTGFRETVRVEYDPTLTTPDVLLYAFFEVIDPTLVNRQGNDTGEQYQAGVFWEPGDDHVAAEVTRICDYVRSQTPGFAVEVKPLKNFFAAEEYHQDYLVKNPSGYCHVPFARIEQLAGANIDPDHYRKLAAGKDAAASGEPAAARPSEETPQ